MERTKNRLVDPDDDRESNADYFVIATEWRDWHVSREMAQSIEASLSEAPSARWLVFVDITGSRVRVRARLVEGLYQSTAEQRAQGRAFHRARRKEEKAERDWDDEEW